MRDPIYHPFAGVTFAQWWSILAQNGLRIHDAKKFAWLTAKSIRNSFEAASEARQYGAQIGAHPIAQPPIFIVGHWRSGTTHLENILCQDPAFGYLNVIQSIYPYSFLTRGDAYAGRFVQTKRYMDNVALAAKSPSEEEVALAVLAPGSFWHGYYFPKKMDDYFDRYVLFKGIADHELTGWKNAYDYLLRKLSFAQQGKPLLLKNPPNTSRISVLKAMFPGAKFVHIHRNPYEVFVSRMAQFNKAVLKKALQPITRDEWHARTLRYYVDMMDAHLEQRKDLPDHQYVEVSFDELRRAPLATIEKIYSQLQIESFGTAQAPIKAYLQTLGSYEQNQYQMDTALTDLIYQHWHRTIDMWDYKT
ncbi:sulfotransferase [Caenimonas sp. SL110]|uniref:sulfotransferase family protein n=1 Tax=Caenimonas sp. SL110 TaxID=1450524 RepID=UPI00069DF48C|nr:sulfotransferase [Caenimonas sp. SL110]